jgi:glycosyltransferase involved in cell wall biosynthesis
MTDDIAPTVSVVIPVFDGGESFRACLSSLAALAPAPHEVIVVDDGSGDGSARLASEFGAQVVSTPVRSGPAHARNAGARQACSDILLFVDADVAVPPDTVGRVAQAFRRAPDLAALFGSYDDAPAAADFLSQYKNLMHHYVHQTGREDAFTFWAGCGAVRRELFLNLGGFDERYREPAIEDIELGYRLKSAGCKILLLKTLQVKHMKPWSPPGLVRTDFTRRALPWAELILQQHHFNNDLNIGWSGRISVASAYGLIGALLAAWRWPLLLALAGVFVLVLLLLNLPLYRFFARKRGLFFALRTIPWHWFYFLYSGLAFALALVRHLCRRPGLLWDGKSPGEQEELGPTGAISAP